MIGEPDFNMTSNLLKSEEYDNENEFKNETSDKLEMKLYEGKYGSISLLNLI